MCVHGSTWQVGMLTTTLQRTALCDHVYMVPYIGWTLGSLPNLSGNTNRKISNAFVPFTSETQTYVHVNGIHHKYTYTKCLPKKLVLKASFVQTNFIFYNPVFFRSTNIFIKGFSPNIVVQSTTLVFTISVLVFTISVQTMWSTAWNLSHLVPKQLLCAYLWGGGADSRGDYVSKHLYFETKESGPLGGGGILTGSANDDVTFSRRSNSQRVVSF